MEVVSIIIAAVVFFGAVVITLGALISQEKSKTELKYAQQTIVRQQTTISELYAVIHTNVQKISELEVELRIARNENNRLYERLSDEDDD